MKNISYCISLICLLVSSLSMRGQAVQSDSGVDLSSLSFEESLMVPSVPQKQADYIKEYMKREAQAIVKQGFHVETTRKGEVLIVTIPAAELFAPNDTVLLTSASEKLKIFLPYFKTPGKFRVVLAMHSDDTGSNDYLLRLTEDRIVALYDYFDSNASNTELLLGYPMADSDPLAGVPNTSIENRSKNRRLEVYIIPGHGLIEQAKLARK